MKIKLVSDLHIDINKDNNFKFRYEDYDVLFIAGDIAGSYIKEKEFLEKLGNQIKKPIYVIAGNHLGYDYCYIPVFDFQKPIQGTKQWSIDYLKKHVPENVHYMDNEYVKLGNYILFAGTMYSDYKLYPNQYLSIRAGGSWLNDFRYVHIYDKKQKIIRRITPYDYIKYYSSFMRKLKKCLKETTEDIILLTHFTPSIKCISDKYLNTGDTYLNASYASNMEKFILKNPRIKYWHCGHCHDSKDFMIGQCRVILEPYGYFGGEQTVKPAKWSGKTIEV